MSVTVHLVLVPSISAFQQPYPETDRQPPKTHKKPEAIAEWRAVDEKKWIAERTDSCVGSPRESRIVMAGLLDAYGTRTILRAPTEGEEPALLRAFCAQLGKGGGPDRHVEWHAAVPDLDRAQRAARHRA